MNIVDLSNLNPVWGAFYGGDAGAKESIIYNHDVYMIKYPKTTRDLVNPQLSYTTSPLSEHLGSQIYKSFGVPTHDIFLGKRRDKIVVACKDFTRIVDERHNNRAQIIRELIPFHNLKNDFMSSDLESYSGSGSETLLSEVLATINGQSDLKVVKGALERFWDMFVIDAFIGNNDRNNGNWGLLFDYETSEVTLAPVYDNGNAFFNKRSIAQMEKRLAHHQLMEEDSFLNPTCVYKYTGLDNEGHTIKPFDFMARGEIEECNQAIERFVNTVNFKRIKKVIDDIPEAYGSLQVMPQIQKDFYKELLKIRCDKIREFWCS